MEALKDWLNKSGWFILDEWKDSKGLQVQAMSPTGLKWLFVGGTGAKVDAFCFTSFGGSGG